MTQQQPIDPKAFAAALQGMARAAEPFAAAMRKMTEHVRAVGAAIDHALWVAYREAGYPYGPNYAGRDRWLRERAEAARLREEADRIDVLHEGLADLRRIVRGEGR